MKVAILGDIHFGARNDSEYFSQKIFGQLDEFLEYIKENKISAVIQAGDIFDRRKYINFKTLHNAKMQFFEKLAEFNIPVYVIVGNHDTYFKNKSEINSPDLLLKEYDVNIIQDFQTVDFGGVLFDLIGWINESNFNVISDKIKNSTSAFAVGHFELKDFPVFNDSSESESTKDITSHILSKYQRVFSGHYHHPTEYDFVEYVGSVSQLTWKDLGDTKGFIVFDTESKKRERVDFSGKIFTNIEYSDDLEIGGFDFSHYDGLMVHVIIPDFETVNRAKLDIFIELLGKHAHSCDIIENQISFIDSNQTFDIDSNDLGDTMTLIENQLSNIIQSEKISDIATMSSYIRSIHDQAISNIIEPVE